MTDKCPKCGSMLSQDYLESRDFAGQYKIWRCLICGAYPGLKINYGKESPASTIRRLRGPIMITYQGITRTVKEWAKIVGLDQTTLTNRIRRLKWSVEKALYTAPNPKKQRR